VLPADNHVHTEWSYDTPADASMVRSCEQAVAIGLPAIAFTEHLEFTASAPGDAIVEVATDHRWWSRIRPLDVTGYMASIEECRQRFPGLRIRAGVEAGEPHLFAASAGAIVRGNAFERVLGSLHAVPYKGRLVAADALFGEMSDDAVMRYYFAELVDLIEGSDLFQVLAHLDFPRRYWPKGAHLYREEPFEEEYRAVLRALASTGRVLEVNTKSPLASVDQIRWWRAGPRSPSGATRTCRAGSATASSSRSTSSRRPGSRPAAIPSTSGACEAESGSVRYEDFEFMMSDFR
jgi:histidinol-phosphatase (PHP family)